MIDSLYISTTESGSGKAVVALGILEFVLRKTHKIGFFRPLIATPPLGREDADIALIREHFELPQSDRESYGLLARDANNLIAQNRRDEVVEQIITRYKALEERCDFILCEGSDYLGTESAFEFDLNREIAENLGCPVLILGNAANRSLQEALNPVKLAIDAYRNRSCPVIGAIVNKVNPEQVDILQTALERQYAGCDYLLATFPHEQRLDSPSIGEVAMQIGATVLHGMDRLERLVMRTSVAAMQMHNALSRFRGNSLIITPGDRSDIIVSMLHAHHSRNYPNLAGLLLTGGLRPEPVVDRLIEGSSDLVPILSVETDTYATATKVGQVRTFLKSGDRFKIDLARQLFNRHVPLEVLERYLNAVKVGGMTAKMFAYTLERQAKVRPKHIVLPEGTDPRILKAAESLLMHGAVSKFTLLGKVEDIERAIRKNNILLDRQNAQHLNIIDPANSPQLDTYTQTFFELRKHKGITLEAARDYLLDSSYFGTMMVYAGDADGMVSGAAHTTQHTIRPALQIVKTNPEVDIVSSVFLMCMANRILLYADCAINPNPNAEQLADIAIASAATASAFCIEPRVAMLSYSSGASGKGEDVEKVRHATAIARARRPDLAIEGPIQYDAAVDPEVAAQKLPHSVVAGRATVFVFPDLNTGNNTYKAVQRETNAVAIGPILQGLKKPINDLSRGCTVEDVKNTILITAIQAEFIENKTRLDCRLAA